MTAPVFRAATRLDLPALVRLLADDALGATREDVRAPLDPAYELAFDSIAADPNNELTVAEIDGELAGMLQLTFIPCLTHTGSWRCLIEGVRIAGDFRGRGLGTRLIEWAIARARRRQCRIVQLTSDSQRPDAIRFYRALGFADTHVGFKLKL